MEPIKFEQANGNLAAPEGMEDEVLGMPVYGNPDKPIIISCWKLTKKELAEVMKTGNIWLKVYSETTFPISLSADSPWPVKKDGVKQ